jgi:hypothetical protein
MFPYIFTKPKKICPMGTAVCWAVEWTERHDEFNIICSVYCDYNHLYTPTNAHNLYIIIINHAQIIAQTCRRVRVYVRLMIVCKLCKFVGVYG